jgi:hypothetical protein
LTFLGSGIGLSPFITVNETSGCTSKNTPAQRFVLP